MNTPQSIKCIFYISMIMLYCIMNGSEAIGGNPHKKVDKSEKLGRGKGSGWWGLIRGGDSTALTMIQKKVVYNLNPELKIILRKKQRRLVRDNPGVLQALIKGANLAVNECQHQFRNRRWNCSTKNFARGKHLFGKIVDRGCRETAFLYAITSAAVTHSIARACSEGAIDTCTCDYSHHNRSPLQITNGHTGNVAGVRDWEWGGCSDNIGFGAKFAREFVDSAERGKTLREKTMREKMNLHNNEVGRLHVLSEMRQECKCHGMSGSCTVKTCWMRLPSFRTIGDILKDRFDGSSRVANTSYEKNDNGLHQSSSTILQSNNIASSPNSIRNAIGGRGGGGGQHSKKNANKYVFNFKPYNPDHKPPGHKDLVYVDPSPGFCVRNPKLGVIGTIGRLCNDTSIGVDGCDLMCCGRGYRTSEIVIVERCSCTFHWCCDVKCKTCRNKKIIHTCI